MSKLTKEQIEQERVKFEKIFKNELFLCKYKSEDDDDTYISDLTRFAFKSWIACAELKRVFNGNH